MLSQVYGSQSGSYTKVGRLVNLTFIISLTTEGTFSGSHLKISGFPFTLVSTPTTINLGQAYFSNFQQNIITLGFQGHESATSAYLWVKTTASTSREYLSTTGLANNSQITASLTYIT